MLKVIHRFKLIIIYIIHMDTAPKAVMRRFEELKKQYLFYIALIKINGRYYVYRRTSRWDKQAKRPKSVSEYIGKIDNGGKFIKRQSPQTHRPSRDVEYTKARSLNVLDEKDMIIAKNLSMNSRISLSKISKRVALSQSAVERRIRMLEDKIGMQYSMNIDVTKLGYFTYIVYVRSNQNLPSRDMMLEELKAVPRIQLAAITKGRYCLILLLIAESNSSVKDLIRDLRSSTTFIAFRSKWYVTPYYLTYGFLPMREEFFKLLEGRIWHRGIDKNLNSRTFGAIRRSEYAVLKGLSSNSRMSFSEIDRRFSLTQGSARYAFERLKSEGIINEMSINMANVPMLYNAVILMNVIDSQKVIDTRKYLLRYMIEEKDSQINRISFGCDVYMPDGVFLSMPIFEEHELKDSIELLAENVKGISVDYLIVTEVLVGRFNYRKIDVTQSYHYDMISNTYRLKEPVAKIDYS